MTDKIVITKSICGWFVQVACISTGAFDTIEDAIEYANTEIERCNIKNPEYTIRNLNRDELNRLLK